MSNCPSSLTSSIASPRRCGPHPDNFHALMACSLANQRDFSVSCWNVGLRDATATTFCFYDGELRIRFDKPVDGPAMLRCYYGCFVPCKSCSVSVQYAWGKDALKAQ